MKQNIKTKQLHAPIPEEVHKAFKRMTVTMDTTMTAVIEQLLRKWLRDHSSNYHPQVQLNEIVRDWVNMHEVPF